MKHSLRMIIAVILVIAIGFGVWALFFAPKKETSSYNKVLLVLEFSDRLNITANFEELRGRTGHGENFAVTFTGEKHSEIIRVRRKLFGTNSNENIITEDVNSFYSYIYYDLLLTEAMEQYLAYLKSAKKPTRESQNQLEDLCRDYEKQLKELDKLTKDVTKYQKNYVVESGQSDNAVANINLTNAYENLRMQSRVVLLAKAKLVENMRSFAIKFSFSNDFHDMPLTILYDCFTLAISQSMQMPKESENSYLHDTTLIAQKLESYKSGANIFVTVSQNRFVNAYRNLYISYYEGLLHTFSLSHSVKVNVVNNNDFENSAITIEFQNDVKDLLTVFEINV